MRVLKVDLVDIIKFHFGTCANKVYCTAYTMLI